MHILPAGTVLKSLKFMSESNGDRCTLTLSSIGNPDATLMLDGSGGSTLVEEVKTCWLYPSEEVKVTVEY